MNVRFCNIDTDIPEYLEKYEGSFVIDKNDDLYLGLDGAWRKIPFVVNEDGSIEVEDTLTSDSTTNALSANKGKELDERLSAVEDELSNSGDIKKDTLKFYRKLGQTNSDMKPFTDELRASIIELDEFAKLGTGLFIHWGVYAVPAGNYTGEKVSTATSTIASKTSTNYNTEWIMRDLGIPKETYKAYQNQFTAENWDADALCKAASDCGMGYVVITAKHHDGFSLYPTKFGSWDITTAASRNTIIDELKTACDKYKLKFGLYFSQYWDWMATGGFGLNHGSKWCTTDPYTESEHKAYCNNAVLQINEMIDKYNPSILWYDPGTNYSQTYKDIFIKGEEELYPQVITNDRLDYNRTRGDFGTGERTIYLRNSLPVGEACFTMNDTWGYSDNNENKYFGIEKVMKQFIIYSLSYGQNCLMNIGPKADGSIPAKQLECLGQIKDFCNAYGKFKNYKRATTKSQPSYGYTIQLDGNALVCYVVTRGNPATQNVVIDNVSLDNLTSVEVLTRKDETTSEIIGNKIYVNNMGIDSTTKIGVVRLNYSKEPDLIDANYYTKNTMIPSRVFPMVNNASWDFGYFYYKLNPSRAVNYKTEFIWDSETGNYTLDLSRERIIASPISEDDVTTITITDLSDNSTQTITYGYEESTSDTLVALTNGNRYSLKLVCSGTQSADLYTLSGFTFVPEVVIIHVDSIELNHDELMVAIGGTGQLEATVLPVDATDASITWTSQDETIATVDDGIITAVAAGETNIVVTTTDGNKTATCHVIVTDDDEKIVNATALTFDSATASITIGETLTLNTTITPENATYKNIRWSSSDESVVTVENGLLTAIGEGTATITGTLEYDNISTTCSVTVNPIHVTGITLDKTQITLVPGFAETITPNVAPENATHKDVTWSIDDDTIANVTDGVVFAKKVGTTTITATATDGSFTATCALTVNPETYDYLWEVDSLDGSADQGDDTGITLFDDDHTNWTIFGYAFSSVNPNTDNNATLLQCVVNSSPWTGYRIDADNNNYPTATAAQSPLIPRFLCGTDRYCNPLTGALTGGKPKIDVTAKKHPVCLSRNGDVFKFSIDGVNWVEHDGVTTAQLSRLVNCPLTVGFDYRRSSGAMTTTKYRFLKTDKPACVSIKNISEYPFYTLYEKYYTNIEDILIDVSGENGGDFD